MENKVQDSFGTDFNTFNESLKASDPDLLQNQSAEKNIVPLFPSKHANKGGQKYEDIPPEIVAKLNLRHPVGKRSEKLWSVLLSLVKCGFNDKQITETIIRSPVGEKALEKPNPEEWLQKQLIKARNELKEISPVDCGFIDSVISGAEKRPELLLEDRIIEELAKLQVTFPAVYAKYRGKIKKIKGAAIGSIEKAIKALNGTKKSTPEAWFRNIMALSFLFCDPAGNAYIEWRLDGKKIVQRIGSRETILRINSQTHKKYNVFLNRQNLDSISGLLESYAIEQGTVRDVFLRHGFKDGTYYIDIGDETRTLIKIDSSGFKIVQDSAVAFLRTKSMQSFPYPEPSGNLKLLWKYIKISPEEELLLLSFILETYRPDTQYLILEIIGEAGAGKSEATKVIRLFIDPNENAILSPPKNVEDVQSSAANNAVVCYDNLSNLSRPVQDTLCAMATGGSAATRKYFTNFEEASVKIKTAMIINGIRPLITQHDLADRSIRVKLKLPKKRMPISKLQANFQQDYHKIFTGLMDLFSKALKEIPNVEEDPSVRMGDFLILGEAVSRVLGNKKGHFNKIYHAFKKGQSFDQINDSALGTAIITYFDEICCEGGGIDRMLMKDLQTELKNYSDYPDEWPETARKMGVELKKIELILKSTGFLVKFHNRTRDGYPVSISKFLVEL